MVQQVGDEGEEDGLALVEDLTGDGHRQVGLAGARGPAEKNPAAGVGGEIAGGLVGGPQEALVFPGCAIAAPWVEAVQGHAAEHFRGEVADAPGQAGVVLAEAEDLGEAVGGFQAGTEAFIQAFQGAAHGDDRGQLGVEAVVDNPGRAFPGPRRWRSGY